MAKTLVTLIAGASLLALPFPAHTNETAKMLEPVRLKAEQVSFLRNAATALTARKNLTTVKFKELGGQSEMARIVLIDTLSEEEKEIKATQRNFAKFTDTREAR